MKISPENKELIRQLLGVVRPEIRELAHKLLNLLPSQLRKEWIGRIIGFIAQRIEKKNLGGFQESISDAIEIISDEIGKQVKERKAKKEEIDAINELKRILENVRERLRQAENIEDEKNRIISELQAYESILEFFKTMEEKYVPKEKRRIDWERIFGKLKEIINVINEKGIRRAIEFIREKYPEAKEEVKRQRDEFLRGLKEGWQKGRKKGLI